MLACNFLMNNVSLSKCSQECATDGRANIHGFCFPADYTESPIREQIEIETSIDIKSIQVRFVHSPYMTLKNCHLFQVDEVSTTPKYEVEIVLAWTDPKLIVGGECLANDSCKPMTSELIGILWMPEFHIGSHFLSSQEIRSLVPRAKVNRAGKIQITFGKTFEAFSKMSFTVKKETICWLASARINSIS